MNGRGVPTQSQPQAASLTLSACNVALHVHKEFKKNVQDNALRKLVMYNFAVEIEITGGML
jgi:hypothetical protein